jgi:phosphatidylserine decarboxylase
MFGITRHGIIEIIVGTIALALIGAGLMWVHPLAGLLVLPIWVWLIAFFRDPQRSISTEPGVYVSPADGLVSDVTHIEHDPLINGPAVRVGIFLSVFNVHVNRSPCTGIVSQTIYKEGKFLNALNHNGASNDNESNTIVITNSNGERDGEIVAVVKQIVGLIARRIVCTVKPGNVVERGQRIGMIKFGSRTELTIPARLSPTILVKPGDKVRGGAHLIARIKVSDSVSST